VQSDQPPVGDQDSIGVMQSTQPRLDVTMFGGIAKGSGERRDLRRIPLVSRIGRPWLASLPTPWCALTAWDCTAVPLRSSANAFVEHGQSRVQVRGSRLRRQRPPTNGRPEQSLAAPDVGCVTV
jgi:hypothetical protein